MKYTKSLGRWMLALLLAVLVIPLSGVALAETDFSWDAQNATLITFSEGDAIVIEGQGAVAQGSTVTISKAGTYVLGGTLHDGQVVIAATKNDVVRLVLNGVSITNSESAAIYARKTDELVVILAEGTTNMLTDATEYVYEEGVDEPDAALFAKDSLTIGGSGTLVVMGNYRNGIGTKDDLVIADGNISVTAVNDGLRGRDSATVTGGTVTIVADNDGIKANNTDEDKGWIVIEGGSIDIVSGHDGMQAETALTVRGGTVNIVAGGGAENAEPRAQEAWGGRGRMPGNTAQTDTTATTDDTETESTSYKGMKSETLLEITGGTLTIDAADDALHTNGDMTITGGTMTISTGDDGAHADGDLLIAGGSIQILQSYEGLEGANVIMTGGDVTLTASDDGINAAGGSDGETGMWGADAFRAGSGSYAIDISGGTLWVSAGGDGIDSNGALNISGGDITVHGPTSGGDGALDADGTITVTGGAMVTADSGGMTAFPGSASTQAYIAVSYNTALAVGETVTLRDESGTVLATYTAEKAHSLVLFSLPELTVGSTYTITTSGGITTEVTLSSLQTTVSQTGEASGARGFGGGMQGGGQMPGGRNNRGEQAPDSSGQGTPPQDMPGQPPPDGAQPPDNNL